jgi:serine-type D-Ala-D-Ala carboxypeptidase/endopeptidase
VILRAILSVAVCIVAAGAVAAEPPTLETVVRQRAKALVGKSLVFGVAIGIIDGDKTYTIYAGQRAFGDPAPDERTLFELGSVTKTFTGILLADAILRDEVKLEQPVVQLLGADAVVPKFGDDEIRLVDLATQTSGLPRLPTNLGSFVNPLNPYASYTTDDLDKFLRDYKLVHKPGTEFWYSNLGVGLLGHALAKYAGKSYEELLQQRITGPLGMTDTVITLSDDQQSRLAKGNLSFGLPAMNWDVPSLPGCGAIRSTLHDMLIYLRANMSPDDTQLGKAITLSHEPRFTIHKPAGKFHDKSEIGLTWLITTESDTKVVWHNGMTGGYASYVAMVPEKRWGFVVLGNQATSEIDEFANNLLKDYLTNTLLPAESPAEGGDSSGKN